MQAKPKPKVTPSEPQEPQKTPRPVGRPAVALSQTGKAKKTAEVIINPATDAVDAYNWASHKLEALMNLLEVADTSELGTFLNEPLPYVVDIATGLLEEMNQAFATLCDETERPN